MSEDTNELLRKIVRVGMLLHRYQGMYFRAYGPFANPVRGQGRVLSILKMKPQISQKELSYLLDMRQQSLSELLQKLEKSGLITRAADSEDKRAVLISLTPEGMQCAPEGQENAFAGDTLFDCLTGEERALFEGLLDRLAVSLQRKLEGERQGDWQGDARGRGQHWRHDGRGLDGHWDQGRFCGAGFHGRGFARYDDPQQGRRPFADDRRGDADRAPRNDGPAGAPGGDEAR